MMLAYRIAIFLLLFNASVGIVGAMRVFPTPVGIHGETIPTSIFNVSLWDWKTILISATGIFSVIASLIFKMSVGATIFALTFTASFLPVSSTMGLFERIGVDPIITGMVQGILAFVFLFAFIQIAGGSGE
jgi:hypothetical protein